MHTLSHVSRKTLLVFASATVLFFPFLIVELESNSAPSNAQLTFGESNASIPNTNQQTFIPRSWVITGATRFSETELAKSLDLFIGKPMKFSDLSKISAVIEKKYEIEGNLARAIIPPQDVTEGTVRVEVVEGRFGDVLFDPSGSTSVRENIVRSVLKSGTKNGQLYDSTYFDRRLLIADDLPGVSLTGFLQSNPKPGHLDLVLKSSKEPAYIADLAADNANSRSLGSEKVSFSGMLVSPFEYGETISLQTLKSKGSRYGRLSLGFPLGYRGWKMSLSGSLMNYSVIAPELKAMDISGKVRDQGVSLRYPITRSRERNLYATVNYDHREYLTTVAGIAQKDYSIDNGKIEFSGNFFDKFIKGGANSGSLSFTHGKVSGFGVDENYHTLLNYGLTRQQSLSEKISLFFSFQGQYGLDLPTSNAQQIAGVSDQDYLDSAENFTLGGLAGVRAYPSGEATGPQGQRLGVELRYLFNKSLIIKPFYDWGMVERRDPTSIGPSEYEISGAGLSASWSTPIGFSLQTTYARRIGENPNPLPTGFDQDGSLKKNRWWFVLARSF